MYGHSSSIVCKLLIYISIQVVKSKFSRQVNTSSTVTFSSISSAPQNQASWGMAALVFLGGEDENHNHYLAILDDC